MSVNEHSATGSCGLENLHCLFRHVLLQRGWSKRHATSSTHRVNFYCVLRALQTVATSVWLTPSVWLRLLCCLMYELPWSFCAVSFEDAGHGSCQDVVAQRNIDRWSFRPLDMFKITDPRAVVRANVTLTAQLATCAKGRQLNEVLDVVQTTVTDLYFRLSSAGDTGHGLCRPVEPPW